MHIGANQVVDDRAKRVMVCDRGTSFGYNYLVSDMRGLSVMRETGCPVVFDATHSVQMPGGQGAVSGGQREFVPALARGVITASGGIAALGGAALARSLSPLDHPLFVVAGGIAFAIPAWRWRHRGRHART